MWTETAFLVGALVVTAAAAWSDWRKGEIPNQVTLGALIVGVLAHGVVGALAQGRLGALQAGSLSLLGAAACAAGPFLLYRSGGIGGGDVKLLAALGALCGPMLGVEAEFYGFIIAALYALVRLAVQRKLTRTLKNTASLVFGPMLPRNHPGRRIGPEMMSSLRFAPPLFLGTCLALVLQQVGP